MESNINAIERLKMDSMNRGQWVIVAICIGTLALDGYDVLSIAFAAPGITQEWGGVKVGSWHCFVAGISRHGSGICFSWIIG